MIGGVKFIEPEIEEDYEKEEAMEERIKRLESEKK